MMHLSKVQSFSYRSYHLDILIGNKRGFSISLMRTIISSVSFKMRKNLTLIRQFSVAIWWWQHAKVHQMSHGGPAMRTIPRMLNLTHMTDNLLHLGLIQCCSNHDRHTACTARKHLPNSWRSAHNAGRITQHENQFFDILHAEGPVLAHWKRN